MELAYDGHKFISWGLLGSSIYDSSYLNISDIQLDYFCGIHKKFHWEEDGPLDTHLKGENSEFYICTYLLDQTHVYDFSSNGNSSFHYEIV
jgi:hypothetical protein